MKLPTEAATIITDIDPEIEAAKKILHQTYQLEEYLLKEHQSNLATADEAIKILLSKGLLPDEILKCEMPVLVRKGLVRLYEQNEGHSIDR